MMSAILQYIRETYKRIDPRPKYISRVFENLIFLTQPNPTVKLYFENVIFFLSFIVSRSIDFQSFRIPSSRLKSQF